jgi:hypothetical protein
LASKMLWTDVSTHWVPICVLQGDGKRLIEFQNLQKW